MRDPQGASCSFGRPPHHVTPSTRIASPAPVPRRPSTRPLSSRGPLAEERIARIRLLRDQKLHPERYPGPFSPAGLTYGALVITASALAIGITQFALGSWAPRAVIVVATAAATYVAQDAISRLWQRVKLGVISFWRMAIPTVGALIAGFVLLGALAPEARLTQRAQSAVRGVKDGVNARLDGRQRERIIPVPSGQDTGDGWRLLTANGGLQMVTLAEANAWCATLGDQWALPESFAWPERAGWPNLGRQVYVWLGNGSGASIGLGTAPQTFVSGAGRATEVRGALCLERRANDVTR